MLSSAGSEHLPYKQRVGGSNPSAPTVVIERLAFMAGRFCIFRIFSLSINIDPMIPAIGTLFFRMSGYKNFSDS